MVDYIKFAAEQMSKSYNKVESLSDFQKYVAFGFPTDSMIDLYVGDFNFLHSYKPNIQAFLINYILISNLDSCLDYNIAEHVEMFKFIHTEEDVLQIRDFIFNPPPPLHKRYEDNHQLQNIKYLVQKHLKNITTFKSKVHQIHEEIKSLPGRGVYYKLAMEDFKKHLAQ